MEFQTIVLCPDPRERVSGVLSNFSQHGIALRKGSSIFGYLDYTVKLVYSGCHGDQYYFDHYRQMVALSLGTRNGTRVIIGGCETN